MRLDLDYPAADSHYQTADRKIGLFSQAFPSLSFYQSMIGVITKGSNLAKKGKYDDAAWTNSSWGILKGLERAGVSVSVENLGVIHGVEGPCVFVGNHMSTLETFVMPYLICPHKAVTFVIKKSLVEYPVFKHIMRSRDPIVVGRENPRDDLKSMLEGGRERLEKGISLIVFPQTTRMTRFDPSQFNSIAVKMAKKAGVPVVPVALKTDAWSNGKMLKDFGQIYPDRKVQFAFGEPMNIEGNGAKQQAVIVEHIQNHLAKWQKEGASAPLPEPSDQVLV